MDSVKEWSVTTFKCTKQLLNERRGIGSITNDAQLQEDIDQLQETKGKLVQLLMVLSDFKRHQIQSGESQRQLCGILNEMAMKGLMVVVVADRDAASSKGPGTSKITFGKKSIMPSLTNNSSTSGGGGVQPKSYERITEFLPILNHINSSNVSLTSELQKNIATLSVSLKNNEKLVAALTFICSNLDTLIDKTIEDTLVSIQELNFSRLELDAERNSQPATQTFTTYSGNKLKLARQRYEQLREEVQIKMKFLDDNILKVVHKQLLLFNGVFASYSSGNTAALDSALRQFSIKGFE